jgi:hypothetical protein
MTHDRDNDVCQQKDDDDGTSQGWDKDRKQYPTQPKPAPPTERQPTPSYPPDKKDKR